jgi:pyruvate,water dikinase
LVLPLSEIRSGAAAETGPKAAHLARMLEAGLPVPPGFCVTGRAYRQYLTADHRLERIKQALGRLSAGTADSGAVLAQIRSAIYEAPLAAELREQIERHWRELGGTLAAVRSSATAEDLPGQSFAGQHETYLGVADLETCLRRVKDCWASLWSRRALEYRARSGIDHLDADMAVIVQALVAACGSGSSTRPAPRTRAWTTRRPSASPAWPCGPRRG